MSHDNFSFTIHTRRQEITLGSQTFSSQDSVKGVPLKRKIGDKAVIVIVNGKQVIRYQGVYEDEGPVKVQPIVEKRPPSEEFL